MSLSHYTIAQWIYRQLHGVGVDCYSFYAEEPVGDFAVYDNISISYDSSKDGCAVLGASFRVTCVAKTFAAVNQMAAQVTDTMLGASLEDFEVYVTSSTSSRSESTANQYIIELNFNLI